MKILSLLLIPLITLYAREYPCQLKAHTTEITFNCEEAMHDLFYELKTQEKDYELWAGDFYKNDEFLFCERLQFSKHRCYAYLSLKYNGNLASFYRDPSFGKGNLFEFMETKPINEGGRLKVEGSTLWVYPEKKISKFLYQRIGRRYPGPKGSIKKFGNQIVCLKLGKGKEADYRCRIEIPFNHEAFPKPPKKQGDKPRLS